jgi:hypothetical protein
MPKSSKDYGVFTSIQVVATLVLDFRVYISSKTIS